MTTTHPRRHATANCADCETAVLVDPHDQRTEVRCGPCGIAKVKTQRWIDAFTAENDRCKDDPFSGLL